MFSKWFKRESSSDLAPKTPRERVFEKCGGRDCYTGELLDPKTFHVDHRIPRRHGGTDDFENLLPTLSRTNLRKGGKRLEEFREAEALRKQTSGRNVWRRCSKSDKFYYECKKLNV